MSTYYNDDIISQVNNNVAYICTCLGRGRVDCEVGTRISSFQCLFNEGHKLRDL